MRQSPYWVGQKVYSSFLYQHVEKPKQTFWPTPYIGDHPHYLIEKKALMILTVRSNLVIHILYAQPICGFVLAFDIIKISYEK